MANKLRIKRRASGSPGAPTSLENAELAYNEVDDVLYYGKGTGGVGGTATTIEAIAGTVKANVNSPTFTGTPAAPTATAGTNTTQLATTAFVQAAVTSGSVSDGDKGDITVSGSGSIWTIDSAAWAAAPISDDTQDALDLKIDLSEKGANSGVATLDSGGKIPTSQLPAIAITDTFVVASQAAMLALTAEPGDVAIRTDINKTFILTATPASTLGNWQEVLSPTAAVSSVFGRTGAVVATSGDYAVADVTGAAPLASPTFTGTPVAPTATAGTSTTQLATTAFVTGAIATSASGLVIDSIADADTTHAPSRNAVFDALALKAPLASPALTGTPTAPTAATATNTTQVATTAYVKTQGYTTNTGTVTSVAVSGGTTGLTTSGGPITTSGTITLAGTLAIANGGTGSTSASAARTALGLGTMATQNATAVAITGGTIDGITIDGGTF